MAKRGKKTAPHYSFKIALVITTIVIVFAGLLYIAITTERYQERQPLYDHFAVELSYKTEFCANKLSSLSYELDYMQKGINEEKQLAMTGVDLITVQPRELTLVQNEFDNYRVNCEQLDEEPTPDLCATFLEESKQELIYAQEQYVSASNTIQQEMGQKELRKSQRIYAGLQAYCNNEAS